MSRGQIDATTLVADTVNAALKRVLELFLEDLVERTFNDHRLAYVFMDEDSLDKKGKPAEVFVCKCGEGFERRKFNEHLKAKLKEV